MIHSRSVKSLVFIYIFTVAIASILAVGLVWIWSEQQAFTERANEIREEYTARTKALIQSEVDRAVEHIHSVKDQAVGDMKMIIRDQTKLAWNIAENIWLVNKDEQSPERVRELILEALTPLKTGDDDRMTFILDKEGKILLSPKSWVMQGLYIEDIILTPSGKPYTVKLLQLVGKFEESFVEYKVESSLFTDRGLRVAFVKWFEPLGLYIGTSDSLDVLEENLKSDVLGYLGSIRFGENGYIFGSTYQGIGLLGPKTGESVWDIEDANGKKVVQALIAAAMNGGGFVEYTKPAGTGRANRKKISYAQGIQEWGWYIGAGEYTDDIEAEIAKQRLMLRGQVNQHLLITLLLLFVVLVLAFLATRQLSKRLGRSFEVFSSFFSAAATGSVRINPDQLEIEEFQDMALSANAMIEERQEIEERLLHSNRLLEGVISQAPFAILFATGSSDNWMISMCNKETERILGVPANVMKKIGVKNGKHIGAEGIDWSTSFIDGTPWNLKDDPLARAMSRGEVQKGIEMIVHKSDGESTAILLNSGPVRDDNGRIVASVVTFLDISELKRVQGELEQERRKIISVLEAVPAFVFLQAQDTSIKYANLRYRELFGEPGSDASDSMLKRRIDSCETCPTTSVFDSRRDTTWQWHDTESGRSYTIIDTYMTDTDGSPLVLEMGLDVTSQERAAEEVRHLRNFLKSVIDSMPSVIIAVDGQGCITQWNRQAGELTGMGKDEALGRPVHEVLSRLRTIHDDVERALASGQAIKRNKQVFLVDGQTRYEDITVYPLIDRDDSGAVIRLDDVTDRARIEEVMVQTEKMMSVGGLAAGMAHEINNPLGGILQGAQNIVRRLSPELPKNEKVAQELGVSLDIIRDYLDQRKIFRMLDGIKDSGERAAKIVSNMLNFSRRSESKRQPCDITEIVEATIVLASNDYDLKKKYDFRRIAISRDYSADIPPVNCTRTEIEQVLLNLLKNAAQAMAISGQERDPKIEIRVSEAEGHVVLEVQDNGPGMDDEVRKRVFEPFFTTKEPGMGTGLGLSVSFFIVSQNHEGTFTVDSKPGEGTTFVIRLPFKRNAKGKFQKIAPPPYARPQ